MRARCPYILSDSGAEGGAGIVWTTGTRAGGSIAPQKLAVPYRLVHAATLPHRRSSDCQIIGFRWNFMALEGISMLRRLSLNALSIAFAALLAGSGPAASAETVTVGGATFVNKGLVGVGRMPSDLRDHLGETIGSGSGLAVDPG